MILLPNIETTVFIDGDNYCAVAGHPLQIAEQLLIEEIKIDSKMSVIRPICGEISIYDNGSVAYMIYDDFFKSHNIKTNKISAIHPKKFFKECVWRD